MFKLIRRLVIGKPLESSLTTHERFTIPKGLAILSADALSSVAYAGEEILHILVPVLGLAAFNLMTPIAAAIIILLFIVSLSYRQIIQAFPKSSGGAYIVAKENLGELPGLIAGASLLFDYVLTVAVSVSAGIAAFTSAFPTAIPYRVELCLLAITFLVIMNLRGITESATAFSYPTYGFILGMFVLIGIGLYKVLFMQVQLPTTPALHTSTNLSGWALIWLSLRAFSSGCTALTGVEAVSNAVPNFKEPENRNAQRVLLLLALLLFVLFGGLTILTRQFHIVPSEKMTVIAQVAQIVFGKGLLFYIFQATTLLVLVLAANTAFAGFPMLASLMAKDGYLPRYMALRGDKLVFSNGIIGLGLLSAFLIYVFGGITTRLIPLYAVGVFTSFTLAQSGMVKKWLNSQSGTWKIKLVINGFGAIVTGTVMLVIAFTKFAHGAWVIIVLIPIMVAGFRAIHRHYQDVRLQLDFDNYHPTPGVKHKLLIPVASLTNVVANTIDYARTMSDDITAVHISIDPDFTEKFRRKWEHWHPCIQLKIIPSPYRSVFNPLIDYIMEVEKHKAEGEIITVLIPEFITTKWWHRFLHNQTALFLQNIFVFHKDIVVTTVPYHLKQ